MKRKKFDLTNALRQLFCRKLETPEELLENRKVFEAILRETGLTPDEMDEIVRQMPEEFSVAYLKYRIFAVMDKAKRDSSYLI